MPTFILLLVVVAGAIWALVNLGFPAFFLVLVVVTGVIWAAEKFVLRSRRRGQAVPGEGGEAGAEPAPSILVEYGSAFFPVFLVVFVLRSFVVEPFQIPSGSMLPTLQVGDFILVNKYAYGLRFPVFDKKLLEVGAPERGDVVVFRYPRDPDTPFIKRVVGLPGDRIEYRDQTLYVNGEAAEQTLIGPYDAPPSARGSQGAGHIREALPGRPHDILIHHSRTLKSDSMVVPDDAYYVLGDNRDNSQDSRFWGVVKDELLIGRAFGIWMHWDRNRGLKGFNFSRIGDGID